MTTIDNIPLEIMTQCLSYLPCSDLGRTALVSHKFHTVSTTQLYQAPCLTSMNGAWKETPGDKRMLRRTPRMHLFLRTLLSPGGEQLSAQVRSLRLRLRWHNQVSRRHSKLSQEVEVLMEVVASRIGIKFPLESESFQVLLLLHVLPRLQVLHLTPAVASVILFGRANRYPSRRQAIVPSLPLDQLREFSYSWTRKATRIHAATVGLLLGLPNLRRIDVQVDNKLSKGPWTTPPRSSGVTRLRLTHADVSPEILSGILSTPVALTHFSYSTGSSTGAFDLSHLRPALEAQRDTLQVLHVNFVGIRHPGNDRAGTLGSLRGWLHLRELLCPMVALLGRPAGTARLVDMLPENLRELEIVGDVFWTPEQEAEQVLQVVALKKLVVPALRRIVMSRRDTWVAGLQSACDGVEVVLEDRRYSRTAMMRVHSMWREVYSAE